MIKKFNQFLNEHVSVLEKTVSLEEIEDQFLRLKEVLGCSVHGYDKYKNVCSLQIPTKEGAYYIFYIGYESEVNVKKLDIEGELRDIKYRIEQQYPILTVKFLDGGITFNSDGSRSLGKPFDDPQEIRLLVFNPDITKCSHSALNDTSTPKVFKYDVVVFVK